MDTVPNSAARARGLLPGDLLVAVAGTPTGGIGSLPDVLAALKAATRPLTLVIRRPQPLQPASADTASAAAAEAATAPPSAAATAPAAPAAVASVGPSAAEAAPKRAPAASLPRMPTAGSARAAVASAGHAVKSLLSSGVQAIQAVDRAIDKAIDQSAKVCRALGLPLSPDRGCGCRQTAFPQQRNSGCGCGCCDRGQRQFFAVDVRHTVTVDNGRAHMAAVGFPAMLLWLWLPRSARPSCPRRHQQSSRELRIGPIPVLPACLQTVEKAARATVSGSKRASARLAAGRSRGGGCVCCASERGSAMREESASRRLPPAGPRSSAPLPGAGVERSAVFCHSAALSICRSQPASPAQSLSTAADRAACPAFGISLSRADSTSPSFSPSC